MGTIVVLISWSIATSLIIFGPMAFFSKLGKISDSKEGNSEMREIVTGNETPKRKTPKKSDALKSELLHYEKALRTPRLVLEQPSRPKTDTFLTLPRKPTPEYTLNLNQEMLSKTMPLSQHLSEAKTYTVSQSDAFTSPTPSTTRFMTIDRHNRSRSYNNLAQSSQDLEPDTDDEVFITENPREENRVKSELVSVRTTPSRKINMPD